MQALFYSLFTGVFLLFPFVNLAQDQPEFSYELRVTNTKGQPESGRSVVFVETSTFERLTFKTDASGQLSLTFDHGKIWLGSVGEMHNCIEIDVSFGDARDSKLAERLLFLCGAPKTVLGFRNL